MNLIQQRTYVLSTKMWVPLSLPNVFEPFSGAFQLQQLTPPWLKFRVLTPGPIEMRRGQLIDYQIGLHGMPIRWRTEITDPVADRDHRVGPAVSVYGLAN